MKNEPDLFSGTISQGDLTRVLYLDTETTGADSENANICELAMLLSSYRGFEREAGGDVTLESLVRPPEPVPPEASAIHHITNAMLDDKPAIEALTDKVGEIVQQADVICAHNADYDLTILRRQLPNVFAGIDSPKILDSLRLSRHIWPMIPSHSLQALRYRFELDCNVQGDAHRAMFDTELVRALVEHVTVSGLVDSSNWSELVSFAQSPLEVLVFPFGKYRGKLVEDVAAQDRDYVSWLLRQEWVPKDYPDLYHTMLEKTTSKEMKK